MVQYAEQDQGADRKRRRRRIADQEGGWLWGRVLSMCCLPPARKPPRAVLSAHLIFEAWRRALPAGGQPDPTQRRA